MATDAEKGLALLKALVAEHEFNGRDHDLGWSKCPRCRAIERMSTDEEAIREVKAFLDNIEAEFEHQYDLGFDDANELQEGAE